MKSNRLMILQAIGVFLQGANAQIALLTHSAGLAGLLTAAIGAYQWYIQKMGNESLPAPAPGTSQTIQTVETIKTTVDKEDPPKLIKP